MNHDKKLTPQELMDDVSSKKGKTGGWPNYFDYIVNGDTVTISVENQILDKKATRRLDPWGLAFLIDAKSRCGIEINNIGFAISGKTNEIMHDKILVPDLEAFRRRISFLSINNQDLHFGITINGETLELFDSDTLFSRPDNEKIHGTFKRVAKDNLPGRLEKDFQTWLFANGVTKTNERLAVLGEDFFKMKNKATGIIREFPTGVFQDNVSKGSRILPTEFVDIVTLNKFGKLAVIELKLNDSQLEVIAQLMDYALFFRSYRDKLWPIITEWLQPKSQDITCYVVNNHFHSRFDDVIEFYSTTKGSYGFRMIKVVLGQYLEK